MQNFYSLVSFTDLVATSKDMLDMVSLAERVAETSLSVFIWGERGSGAFQLAQLIHLASDRSDQPFLTFNADGLTTEAQSRELFGLMSDGKRYIGKLELVSGGTLLMENIELLDRSVQSRLFSTLHEREFIPDNMNKTVKVGARIISSGVHSPLYLLEHELVKSELLYRLEGIPFELPMLKSRGSDIVTIAERLIHIICENSDLPKKRLTLQAVQKIFKYEWLGNVEELYACLEKACFFTGNELIIDSDDIIFSSPNKTNEMDFKTEEFDLLSLENNFILPFDEVKKKLLIKALTITKGDVSKSAELLGIGRATAFRLIKEWNLNVK